MNVFLIYFLLIIFISQIFDNNAEFNDRILTFDLNYKNISIVKGNIQFYHHKDPSSFPREIDVVEMLLSTYMEDSIFNYSMAHIHDEGFGPDINYHYIKYKEMENKEQNNISLFDEEVYFKFVNITNNTLNPNISSILSLNNIDDKLILLNNIDKRLIIVNDKNFTNNNDITEEEKNVLKNENLCHNNSLIINNNKKFICKLDFILLGHEDLPKDDVYLAKSIEDSYSTAYFDNMLSYSIFPYAYLDYFYTSFFSELNDGCTKKTYQRDLEGKENTTFYYITCPKKKIDIYTKRRKLSIIINKFSYRLENLFVDSFDFLNNDEINVDNYYFNILFEQDRTNFVLGLNFLSKIMLLIHNNKTYIYSKERINYTEDLTDDSPANFEKWLYILTASSFTLVLIIFTIIGCFHSRKTKSELNQMLKAYIK